MISFKKYSSSLVAAAFFITSTLSAPTSLQTGSISTRSIESGIPLRILPLGDSITYGYLSTTGDGYRQDLLDLLPQNPVCYIGSVKSGTMANPQNEGHSGATVSEIANYTKVSLPEQPNLVLLMAGVNDINRPQDPAGAPERLAALVDQIFIACPTTTIVVAQLTPYPSKQSQVDDFNAAMAPLINAKIEAGKHIVMVKMEDYVASNELADGLHPNDVGYDQMAHGWLAGIEIAGEKKWIREPIDV